VPGVDREDVDIAVAVAVAVDIGQCDLVRMDRRHVQLHYPMAAVGLTQKPVRGGRRLPGRVFGALPRFARNRAGCTNGPGSRIRKPTVPTYSTPISIA